MLSGVDVSQLDNREIRAIPFDYIRQVCYLPVPEQEVTEEEVVQ